MNNNRSLFLKFEEVATMLTFSLLNRRALARVSCRCFGYTAGPSLVDKIMALVFLAAKDLVSKLIEQCDRALVSKSFFKGLLTIIHLRGQLLDRMLMLLLQFFDLFLVKQDLVFLTMSDKIFIKVVKLQFAASMRKVGHKNRGLLLSLKFELLAIAC